VPSGSHTRVCLSPSVPNPLDPFTFGAVVAVNLCVSLFLNGAILERPAREISTQLHHSHIAMSCNPTIAGKVSPTRIPPPICASAPDSRFETELKTGALRTI
jgi:hypothetical protein